MTKRDKIAELGRKEHEEREERRHRKRKLRGFKKSESVPRSIRAHRYADTPVASPPQQPPDERA